MPYKLACSPNLWKHFPNQDSILSDDFSLCLVGTNLSSTKGMAERLDPEHTGAWRERLDTAYTGVWGKGWALHTQGLGGEVDNKIS